MAVKQKNVAIKNPSRYAEELGHNFIVSKKKADTSSLGQYFTPQVIAELIAKNFSEFNCSQVLKILDPGAGAGILSNMLCERISTWKHKPNRIELIAYEIDKTLIPVLRKSFSYLKDWLENKNISLIFSIHDSDFVLENGDILNQTLQQSLFGKKNFEEFDLIIANPPYFKISKSDPRAKATSSVIHGQPNIYALFMAIAASLLKENGQLGFITPRSYASGLYFKKFRQNFFNQITPVSIHIFESRDKAFNKDGVLQENVILHGKKDSTIDRQNHKVKISSCDGLSDINNVNMIEIPLAEIIAPENDYILHIPTKITQREIVKIVKSWKHNLHSLGLDVSTGPIVPFRVSDILGEYPSEQSAPLLWLHNVTTMHVSWPIKSRKPQYVKISQSAEKFLVPNVNYVLVRRFSAKEEKKRLVAAPLLSKILKSKFVGIENHINYIYRKIGELSETEALGLAAILNSSLLDSYFRIFNGNTQVSATELRNLPLPTLRVIERVGSFVKSNDLNQQETEEKVSNLIKQYA
ncbi:Eco57I restriction-modification methylase domain-containing protein [Patescibacteria group bacterium]|nr:Eco57I restriction-modification methylase domain-containing protein [Patescibacteria group bacterium]